MALMDRKKFKALILGRFNTRRGWKLGLLLIAEGIRSNCERGEMRRTLNAALRSSVHVLKLINVYLEGNQRSISTLSIASSKQKMSYSQQHVLKQWYCNYSTNRAEKVAEKYSKTNLDEMKAYCETLVDAEIWEDLRDVFRMWIAREDEPNIDIDFFNFYLKACSEIGGCNLINLFDELHHYEDNYQIKGHAVTYNLIMDFAVRCEAHGIHVGIIIF
ncbi:hypothetical protein POM88_049297 [Heracleum sosnowskyi]|uniref:Uncharacterized protein n=1 Tax=Heracleum sosnowskyi TaxID=360622 RepID=A0AAD8M0F4_9APIA|nr:hypothetical protein POM88_049297 [Heracleum sosnowskyi]